MPLIGEDLSIMLYYLNQNAVSETFCSNIISDGENLNIIKAKIQDGNSEISWLDSDKLKSALRNLIQISNKESGWNYSLTEFEPLQYTIYNKGDYYDWHIDSHTKPYDNGMIRKLSFSLCLNDDYEGGQFSVYRLVQKQK